MSSSFYSITKEASSHRGKTFLETTLHSAKLLKKVTRLKIARITNFSHSLWEFSTGALLLRRLGTPFFQRQSRTGSARFSFIVVVVAVAYRKMGPNKESVRYIEKLFFFMNIRPKFWRLGNRGIETSANSEKFERGRKSSGIERLRRGNNGESVSHWVVADFMNFCPFLSSVR